MYERLTAREPKKGCAYLANVKDNEQEIESSYPNTLQCLLDCFERLAQYEDSGLSPTEVRDLAKAKIEGRLVELPCKIGDTVSCVKDGDIETTQVVSFYISRDGIGFENGNGYEFATVGDIGKTVFLTREEAEKAVKG